MKKVVIGKCTLYQGDCYDYMYLNKADAVVTDTPYGIGERSGTISKARADKNNYSVYEDTFYNLKFEIVPRFRAALAVTKKDEYDYKRDNWANCRGVATVGPHYYLFDKPDCLGCLYQPASTSMCNWGRITMQPVLFYGRDPKIGKTIQNITYTVTDMASDSRHPCAKPLKATMWMVERASLEGETILDPFMGSGTTGVACVKMNRSFIGIELDPDYFEIACQRIRDAYAQPDMFIEAANDNRPQQQKMEI